MVDRHDRDLILIDPVHDNVREAADPRESEILKDLAEQLRCPTETIETLIDAVEEFVTSPARWPSYQALASARSASASGLTISG